MLMLFMVQMPFVFKAITSALRDLVRFKIAWIIVWPIFVAMFFWFAVGYIFWDNISELTYLVFDEIGIGEWLKKY